MSARGSKLFLVLLFATFSLLSTVAAAQTHGEEMARAVKDFGKALGSGLAVGLAGIGAGYAVGRAGAAATAATVEKPEFMGRYLIYIVLGEGIAIYGLLIAILLLFVI